MGKTCFSRGLFFNANRRIIKCAKGASETCPPKATLKMCLHGLIFAKNNVFYSIVAKKPD